MKKDIDDSHLLACGELLITHKLTIAFAESATAGRLSAEFALVPDAGKFLKGGVVCYDADLKCSLLGVPQADLKAFTPESEIVTCLITSGLQKLIQADIHIGCTGLTTPGGSENVKKPVGTMFLYAMKARETLFSERTVFQGNPEKIVRETVEFLAERLHSYLESLAVPANSGATFASKAAVGGMVEVTYGKLAGEKASSAAVKDFAAMMVKDHGKANEELKAIAADKNIMLPAGLDAEHAKKQQELEAKSGAEFDKAYVMAMVEGHEKTLALMEDGSQNCKDADLKGFAVKTAPLIKHHLDMIKKIQADLK